MTTACVCGREDCRYPEQTRLDSHYAYRVIEAAKAVVKYGNSDWAIHGADHVLVRVPLDAWFEMQALVRDVP